MGIEGDPYGSTREVGPIDIVVIGGGNAALCAALAAADAGRSVVLIERSTRAMRGGNTRHVRNLRDAHVAADSFVTGPYSPDEFLADIHGVTGQEGDQALTVQLVEASLDIAAWAVAHGVHWQMPLKGTLGLARTNRFFLGGGKSLVNAYHIAAAERRIEVRYESTVVDLKLDGSRCTGVVIEAAGDRTTLRPRAVVAAAGGFEANRAWMREYWGDAADNFAIRGSPANDGLVLHRLLEHGAQPVADPTRFHAIAVDARAPMADAGIVSRIDAIPFGIVVNREGRRFYDEGEDIWPKRYAIWGRLIAQQPGQTAHVIFDDKATGAFMATLYPPLQAPGIGALAGAIGLDAGALEATVAGFNDHVVEGTFDGADLDDCRTQGLEPPKSHWARRIDRPPFMALPLRTGVTFTYHGVRVDATARVMGPNGPFENLFAAGEIMAGNILTRGYLAGIGMTIGSVYGRIAGREAARA
jgi:tricarballylate dehydrogenase